MNKPLTTIIDEWVASKAHADKGRTENEAFGEYLDKSREIFPLVNAIRTTTTAAEDKLWQDWFDAFGAYFGGDDKKLRRQWNRVRQLHVELREKYAASGSTTKLSTELQTLRRNCKHFIGTEQCEAARKRGDANDISVKLREEHKPAIAKPIVTKGNRDKTVTRVIRVLAKQKSDVLRAHASLNNPTKTKARDLIAEAVDSLGTAIEKLKAAQKVLK
jgi:hypothetical protein